MYYFICRPSICGILTGIYEAWDFALRIKSPVGAKVADTSHGAGGSGENAGHDLLRMVVDGGFRFCDYSKFIDVLPNEAEAEMVSNGIARKLGDELHDLCLTAMQSNAKDRVDTLYRFLLYAFGVGETAIDHTERPEVRRIRAYYQSVRREGALLFGFPGFERHVCPLGEIYVARIRPKNDVLDFLVLHFVNQRPQDTFLIYDEKRYTFALHIPGLPLQRGYQKIYPTSAAEQATMPAPMETILSLVDRASAVPADDTANIALHLLRGA